jgi:hypothetical protein
MTPRDEALLLAIAAQQERERLLERVEAEWYNGNVTESAYARILDPRPPSRRPGGRPMTCIKCGHDDIHIRYHDAKRCKECDVPPSCERDDCDRKDEHLRHVCRTCGYHWLTDVADPVGDHE